MDIDTARSALEQCLSYVGADADRYGTASTAGPMLALILKTLGRPETADEYVLRVREQRQQWTQARAEAEAEFRRKWGP